MFIEQSRASGKPDAIIEKMVEGRMRKFFEEVALLSQAFVMNPEITVEVRLIKDAEKLARRRRSKSPAWPVFSSGEGVEKEESDFAAEVAAVAKG